MKNLKLSNKIAIISILVFIIILFLLNKLNKVASPILITQATKESYNIITRTINSSVNKVVNESLNTEDLFIMTYDVSGNLVSIDFDSMIVNNVLTNVALEIEREISNIGPTAYMIPFGVVLENSFLSNLGPQIPVKLRLVGSVINDINTKVTNYGINNALIELYVDIEVDIQVALPFISDQIKVNTSVPLALKLIRGNVPDYYSSGSDPLLSVPIE